MNLLHTRSMLIRLATFAALGLAGNTGCGGQSPSSTEGVDPAVAVAGDDLQAFAEADASFHDGHLEFGPITAVGGSATAGLPGLQVQNFGNGFTQAKVDVETLSDGPGTGSCTMSQDCASITWKNLSTVQMDNAFIEVTDYTKIFPTSSSGPVALVNPFPLSTAYASAFKNFPSVQAGSFGTILPGQTSAPVEMKWNFGTATTFSFHVKFLASFPRTNAMSGNQSFAAVAPVNACAMAGASTFLVGADNAEQQVLLPFPFTAYSNHYDRAVVSSNGYVLFYKTGDTPPTLTQNNVNIVTTTGLPIGYYPFWDDLAFDSPDGVCVAVSGTKPFRRWNVLWKNAKISTSQPATGTWTTQKITFSLQLFENDDSAILAWALPSGGIVAQTQGTTANVGYKSKVGDARNFAANSVFLPAVPARYPVNVSLAPYQANP